MLPCLAQSEPFPLIPTSKSHAALCSRYQEPAGHAAVRNSVQRLPAEQQPQHSSKSSSCVWFFSGLSFPLEEEENLGWSMAMITMAAWHRNQWKGKKSRLVPVMALFRREVAFTLSSHPQGQSSYPHCLPSMAAKFLPSFHPQAVLDVHTHIQKCYWCTHGLSSSVLIFQGQSHRGSGVDSQTLACPWSACLSNSPWPALFQPLAVGRDNMPGNKAQLLVIDKEASGYPLT